MVHSNDEPSWYWRIRTALGMYTPTQSEYVLVRSDDVKAAMDHVERLESELSELREANCGGCS